MSPGSQRTAAAAAFLALAATSTWTAAADAPAATVTMSNEAKFEPNRVTIKVGQTVAWTNKSTMVHTVTADPAKAADGSDVELPAGAQPFDSGRLPPGQQFTHTFTKPGLYKYFCVPHERRRMVGVVDVQP